MAVLGSRERLCIHQTVRNRSPQDSQEQEQQQPKLNVNQECRCRVGNTEIMRKKLWQSQTSSYNDDDPPTNLEMDTSEAPQQQQQQDGGNEHDEQERDGDWIDPNSRNKPSCPHYRQLTTTRTAQKTFAQIVPQATSTGIVLYAKRGGERQGLVRTILKTWLPLMVRTRLSNEVLRYIGVNRSHPLEWALKRILKRNSSKLETFTRVVLYKGKEPSN
jgi:hypothetical protein